MKYQAYVIIMERIDGNRGAVREQVRAFSIAGIKQCIRAYRMANRGWYIANLRYNDRVCKIIGETKGE